MGLVRHLDEQCLRIRLGMDRDGAQPEPPRRADDPAGDLAAIGDENALEHEAPLVEAAMSSLS